MKQSDMDYENSFDSDDLYCNIKAHSTDVKAETALKITNLENCSFLIPKNNNSSVYGRRRRRIQDHRSVHKKANRALKVCVIWSIVLALFVLGIFILKFLPRISIRFFEMLE